MSELALYEKRLSRALDCPKPLRRRLLGRTRRMAQDFVAGKPDAQWDEVEEFLGNPRELAQTMLETEDQWKLERYRNRKMYLKRGLLALLIVAFLVSFAGMVYFYTHRLNIEITETLTIYSEETG